MYFAFRGCRYAAILLSVSLLLLISGTLCTVFSGNDEQTQSTQSPQDSTLPTVGLVLLILGCVSAAAEVVLVIVLLVFLSYKKRDNDGNIETHAMTSAQSNKMSQYDLSLIQYSQ